MSGAGSSGVYPEGCWAVFEKLNERCERDQEFPPVFAFPLSSMTEGQIEIIKTAQNNAMDRHLNLIKQFKPLTRQRAQYVKQVKATQLSHDSAGVLTLDVLNFTPISYAFLMEECSSYISRILEASNLIPASDYSWFPELIKRKKTAVFSEIIKYFESPKATQPFKNSWKELCTRSFVLGERESGSEVGTLLFQAVLGGALEIAKILAPHSDINLLPPLLGAPMPLHHWLIHCMNQNKAAGLPIDGQLACLKWLMGESAYDYFREFYRNIPSPLLSALLLKNREALDLFLTSPDFKLQRENFTRGARLCFIGEAEQDYLPFKVALDWGCKDVLEQIRKALFHDLFFVFLQLLNAYEWQEREGCEMSLEDFQRLKQEVQEIWDRYQRLLEASVALAAESAAAVSPESLLPGFVSETVSAGPGDVRSDSADSDGSSSGSADTVLLLQAVVEKEGSAQENAQEVLLLVEALEQENKILSERVETLDDTISQLSDRLRALEEEKARALADQKRIHDARVLELEGLSEKAQAEASIENWKRLKAEDDLKEMAGEAEDLKVKNTELEGHVSLLGDQVAASEQAAAGYLERASGAESRVEELQKELALLKRERQTDAKLTGLLSLAARAEIAAKDAERRAAIKAAFKEEKEPNLSGLSPTALAFLPKDSRGSLGAGAAGVPGFLGRL